MTLVEFSLSFTRARKRLTGTGAGPDGLVGPAGEAERVGPSPDTGEEVALSIPDKVGTPDVEDTSLVDVSWRDMAFGDKITKPGGGVGIDFIIVVLHLGSPNTAAVTLTSLGRYVRARSSRSSVARSTSVPPIIDGRDAKDRRLVFGVVLYDSP
jgi:hypothetical protein